MPKLPEKLLDRLEVRRSEGAFRRLTENSGGIDFTSNDYLGLATYTKRTADTENTDHEGSGGSRLLSGNHPLFEVVENRVAQFHLSDAALVYNSGYDANIGLLSSILQRNDLVFYDKSAHASIRDGIALSRAKGFGFDHNNLKDLTEIVGRVTQRQHSKDSEIYIVTESVFSMEGDSPDIKALSAFCFQNGYKLILDEAHATGVLGPQGRGLAVALGVEHEIFARIITFGKALGSHGAAVLCREDLREYLVNFSRSFIYTTALPPIALRSILKAYDWLESAQGQLALTHLHERIGWFKNQIKAHNLTQFFTPSDAAIQSYFPGDVNRVKAAARMLQQSGMEVRPILHPTVPKGQECLRFSLHAFTTEHQIQELFRNLISIEKT